MYRRWEVPSNASSALSLVWVGLLGRVSLLQILTKYWSQYCSMVKLYNFHLCSHQCPPLTVTPGACSRDQCCTRLGFCLWLSRFEQNSITSDFWPSHSGDCHGRGERQDLQICLEYATQQYDSISLKCSMLVCQNYWITLLSLGQLSCGLFLAIATG